MHYLDTSVIVTALTGEARQADVLAWLAVPRDTTLLVSWWTHTEFASAIGRKLREGSFNAAAQAFAVESYRGLIARSFQVLPVVAADFDRAARFVAYPRAALRSSDALHLAVAHKATMVTLDKRMATGGEIVGVATLLLSPD